MLLGIGNLLFGAENLLKGTGRIRRRAKTEVQHRALSRHKPCEELLFLEESRVTRRYFGEHLGHRPLCFGGCESVAGDCRL